MSTAAEMARAEAERAESEPDEEELEQQESEEQPQPEPQPAEQPQPAEPTPEMFAAVREANVRHHKAVRKIMGSFIEGFIECDSCGGSGLTLPQPAGVQLEHDPTAATCPVCAGWGELETGSKRDGFAVQNCGNCNGKGWVGPSNLNALSAAEAAVASVGAAPASLNTGETFGATPLPAHEDPRAAELRSLGYVIVAPPAAGR